MSNARKSNVTTQILIALILGIVAGTLINLSGKPEWVNTYLIQGLFELGGRLFMASLQMAVVPLVFVSIVSGTASLENAAKLGRIGGKTLGLFLMMTFCAVSLAILGALIVQPGVGVDLVTSSQYTPKPTPSLVDTFVDMVPKNPIQSMAQGEVLQVIVFAILFGIAMTFVGAAGKRVKSLFEDLNEVILSLVMILIRFAPVGVFCLLAKVFAVQGFGAILPLAKYFGLVLIVLCVHGVLVYGSMIRFLAGLSPMQFFRRYKEVPLFAFSTASSNATIPINMEVVEKKLGVPNSIASFVVPVGATVNMDGTAIMQGVATVFVAQVYQIPLTITDYLMVVVTATLASVGTAGVPGVGLVMLAMVFRQVNLPVEGIGLILGIDRLLDMSRTAVNVMGDAIVSVIVAKSENQLDLKAFHSSEG